jgi:subtilisin family serine protease
MGIAFAQVMVDIFASLNGRLYIIVGLFRSPSLDLTTLSLSSGNVTFETKTFNCRRSGGIAAIIYNNEPGTIKGKLSNSNVTSVPALQISAFNGEKFKAEALGMILTIEERMGYGYLSGTSMAAPHVSGVIAKVWRTVRSFS